MLKRKIILFQYDFSTEKKRYLFAWGSGNRGQLGLGNQVNSINIPTEISTLQDEDIVQIAASGDLSAAVTASG